MLTERGKTKKQRPLSPKYCISVVSPEKNNPYVFVYKELNYRELVHMVVEEKSPDLVLAS